MMRTTAMLPAAQADRPSRRSQHCRRGAISAMVIVVLVLLSVLAAAQIQRVVKERRQMRTEIEYLQTQQLAEAGLVRAESARKLSAEYQGETWEVPPGVIHQTKSAQVVIRFTDTGECSSTARYPIHSETPLQVTRFRRLSR